MAVPFEVVHTCVSVQVANAHEVLCDSHSYVTFVGHIFPLFLCIYDLLTICHLAGTLF